MAGVLKVNDGGAAWKNVVPPVPTVPNEVAISTTQPSDTNVELWVDPNGTWADEYATKAYVDGAGWTNLSLINGWYDADSSYGPPSVRKFGSIVMCRGIIGGGSSGTFATMPLGFRPINHGLFPLIRDNNTVVWCEVVTSGNMYANATGVGGWLSLANIIYMGA